MKTDDEEKKNDQVITTEEEIPTDETFSYDGYQVVRGEFFAHINEPSITLSNNKFYVNTACLKRLPEVEYIQILIHQEERKIVVRPSSEDEKESFVWCSLGEKRTPKQVTCKMFFAKVMELTGWDYNSRHKMLGKQFRKDNETLFIFDMDSKQTFQRTITDDGKVKTSRTPIFPTEWEKMFGPTVDEHRKQMEARVFKGYTVFSVADKKADESPQKENE